MKEKLPENKKLFKDVLIYTMLFGLLTQAYSYLNLPFSHDSLLIHQNDMDWQLALGRFMHPVYLYFRGNLVAPFLVGVLSLIFLSMSNFLIVKILKINNKRFIMLICGILAVNPTLIFSNATFMPWSDIYMLALLMAVAAVYVHDKWKFGSLVAIILLGLSVGFYQSYIQVAVVLFIMLLIKDFFTDVTEKEIFIKGIKFVFILVGGLVVYSVLTEVALVVANVQLTDSYNGISEVGNYSDYGIKATLDLLLTTGEYPFTSMLNPETHNPELIALINIIMALITVFVVYKLVRHYEIKKWRLALLLLILAMVPFGINFVYFVSKGMIHTLMCFSFFFLYVLCIMFLDEYEKISGSQKPRLGKYSITSVVTVFISVIMLNNVIFANQLYLRRNLEVHSTLSVMTRMLDRVEQTDGYVLGETEVAIIGTLEQNQILSHRAGFDHLQGIGLHSNSMVTYSHTYAAYFGAILGYPINLSYDHENKEAIKAMPIFPSQDSVQMVDGVIVVKLSEVLE